MGTKKIYTKFFDKSVSEQPYTKLVPEMILVGRKAKYVGGDDTEI